MRCLESLSEILEEHLKDVFWISLTLIISFVLIYTTDAIRMNLLHKVFNSILLIIGKCADLSAEYGGEFIISIPKMFLFNYSILLNDNEYYVLIHGIRFFNGTWKYRFNSIALEPGGKYSVRKLMDGFILTKR